MAKLVEGHRRCVQQDFALWEQPLLCKTISSLLFKINK
jgi:hypothetical protein